MMTSSCSESAICSSSPGTESYTYVCVHVLVCVCPVVSRRKSSSLADVLFLFFSFFLPLPLLLLLLLVVFSRRAHARRYLVFIRISTPSVASLVSDPQSKTSCTRSLYHRTPPDVDSIQGYKSYCQYWTSANKPSSAYPSYFRVVKLDTELYIRECKLYRLKDVLVLSSYRYRIHYDRRMNIYRKRMRYLSADPMLYYRPNSYRKVSRVKGRIRLTAKVEVVAEQLSLS